MSASRRELRAATRREGLRLLLAILAAMWLVEALNAIDGYGLSREGIHPREVGRLWGILTAPFLHANFYPHLVDNTIPLALLGLIIALRGARRLAAVTAIVIVLGGLGTWLISPAGTDVIGASGVVFGYAAYLLARGFFDRSALELLTGAIVGLIWGGALLSSLLPRAHVSWQGHLCGAIAGVIAAHLLRRERPAAFRRTRALAK